MDDCFEVNFFGRQKRKSLCQIKSHLISKNTFGSDTSPISFGISMIQYMLEEIKILLHCKTKQEVKNKVFIVIVVVISRHKHKISPLDQQGDSIEIKQIRI